MCFEGHDNPGVTLGAVDTEINKAIGLPKGLQTCLLCVCTCSKNFV